MNSIGDRLKEIRKKTGLTQKDFGEKIALKPTAIGQMETGDRNVTERTIILICSTFNINEDWLRTGEGEMENVSDTFSLDDYAKQKGLSELEFEIIKGYMELDRDLRKGLMAHLKSIFNKPTAETEKKYDDEEDLSPPRVAEEVKEYSSKELSAKERGEEEYIKNVLKNAPKRVVSASSGTEDINKVV